MVLLLASGAGYRLVAVQLASPGASVPLPPGTLARLPMRIDDWLGRDVPMDPAIVRATDTDDHINRVYQRHAGTAVIGLYIAYGIKARDLMPHRPEVCYPDAGWSRQAQETVRLPLDDATTLDCTLYEFVQSGLISQKIHVLNYFIVDGRYAPDVSLLRSKAWRGSGGIRYMAQVQITCTGDALLHRGMAQESVRTFAAQSAKPIRALLPGGAQATAPPPADARGGAP